MKMFETKPSNSLKIKIKKLKKLMQYGIFLILQIVILTVAQGQNMVFYGTASYGGLNNKGVIFKTDNNGENYTVVHDFSTEDGARPGTGALCNINGVLYGTTEYGGVNNMGVLFSYNTINQVYTNLHDFDTVSSGQAPRASVILALNGKLYGTTHSGGLYNFGTLFEFDIQTGNLTKKIDFDGVNTGRQSFSILMPASNGKLYGVTNRGGLSDWGVLYEYDYTTEVFLKLMDFGNTFGKSPTVLVEVDNGVLYGSCYIGGDFDDGTIFEYTISTSKMIKKFDFNRLSTGSFIVRSLIKASNGKLYGITGWGMDELDVRGGVLFEYDVSAETYSVKQSFNNEMGHLSTSPLLEGSNGYLYGLAREGGLNNMGTLLEYHIDTNALIKKRDFDVATGAIPSAGLIELDEQALGISDTDLNVTEINIYPNPVTDNLTISSKNPNSFEITIFNILGSQVFYKAHVVNNEQLKVANLQTGLYVLKATSISGHTETIKFIKN